MCKYSFLYAAVAVLVLLLLLFLTEVSILTEYTMAQEQSSNQTQIVVVAQTPEEKG
jgi:hypothetical protein